MTARRSFDKRPPVKIGSETDAASAQTSEFPLVRDDKSVLSLPNSVVKPIRGKKFSFATPTFAGAFLTLSSAWRISGRLSRSWERIPAGTTGGGFNPTLPGSAGLDLDFEPPEHKSGFLFPRSPSQYHQLCLRRRRIKRMQNVLALHRLDQNSVQ